MATETLEMMIRMRDELSKPLTAQQKALKGVNEQIRKMKDESRKASGIQKEHAKLLKTQRDNTLNLIPGVKHLRSNMAELGTGMGLAVGASALVIAAFPLDSICWSLALSSLTRLSLRFFSVSCTATFLASR